MHIWNVSLIYTYIDKLIASVKIKWRESERLTVVCFCVVLTNVSHSKFQRRTRTRPRPFFSSATFRSLRGVPLPSRTVVLVHRCLPICKLEWFFDPRKARLSSAANPSQDFPSTFGLNFLMFMDSEGFR